MEYDTEKYELPERLEKKGKFLFSISIGLLLLEVSSIEKLSFSPLGLSLRVTEPTSLKYAVALRLVWIIIRYLIYIYSYFPKSELDLLLYRKEKEESKLNELQEKANSSFKKITNKYHNGGYHKGYEECIRQYSVQTEPEIESHRVRSKGEDMEYSEDNESKLIDFNQQIAKLKHMKSRVQDFHIVSIVRFFSYLLPPIILGFLALGAILFD